MFTKLEKIKSWLSLRSKYKRIKTDDVRLKNYFKIQISQSYFKINKNSEFRYGPIITALMKRVKFTNIASAKVLCVGCRNDCEINAFREKGFGYVIGIDLFSNTPSIMVMDMHAMTFPDNYFDVVYSADSLEHAHDARLAAENMMRVLNNQGYLCLSTPINWRLAQGRDKDKLNKLADCQDFTSEKEIMNLFSNVKKKTIYKTIMMYPDGSKNLVWIFKKNDV